MSKEMAKNNVEHVVPQDAIDKSMAVMAARKDFLASAFNMGWQLALTVLVPVIIGVNLDDRFGTTPSYTLTALILAVGGAVWVIMSTIKQVNREQINKLKKGNKA